MPPNDALDPGPDGTYPFWPRDELGRPIIGPAPMPSGLVWVRSRETGRRVLIDQTLRHPDGTPIVPPDLPPD